MSDSLSKVREFLSAHKVRKKRATLGKYAEGKMKDYLEKRKAEDPAFDYERLYDARSAGGRFPSQIADFAYYYKDDKAAFHGVVEVKEVHHEFRLPKKNFDPGKFGRLARRRQAGGGIVIVICFLPAKLWRIVPFEFFEERSGQPSWDLSQFPTYKSVDAAISTL